MACWVWFGAVDWPAIRMVPPVAAAVAAAAGVVVGSAGRVGAWVRLHGIVYVAAMVIVAPRGVGGANRFVSIGHLEWGQRDADDRNRDGPGSGSGNGNESVEAESNLSCPVVSTLSFHAVISISISISIVVCAHTAVIVISLCFLSAAMIVVRASDRLGRVRMVDGEAIVIDETYRNESANENDVSQDHWRYETMERNCDDRGEPVTVTGGQRGEDDLETGQASG